jgi:hypothetical protein
MEVGIKKGAVWMTKRTFFDSLIARPGFTRIFRPNGFLPKWLLV